MESIVINWLGAMLGLIVAIVLIFKKVHPLYSLFTGSIVGGLAGGASLNQTVEIIISGANSVMPAVIRVIAAGVMAGILIDSGAAEKIAETIVEKLGEKKALLAIALATMVITSVGVFITVSIIIVAPIAISVGKKVRLSKSSILLSMIGGGKAGNIISPNPNTIAVAKGFNVDLASVMIKGLVPAIAGLIITYFVSKLISNKGAIITEEYECAVAITDNNKKPSFAKAIVAPAVAIVLLSINPIANILNIESLKAFKIDSMIILPVAGLIGLIAMGQFKEVVKYTNSGLNKMTGVALVLIGAGGIAGIISNSNLSNVIVSSIEALGISSTFLAPISGVLMSGATASTATATIVAAGTFGKAILSTGVGALSASIMVHTGATVMDHLPHGNFFHVSGESVKMSINERMKLIPYESLIGVTMCIIATIIYGM
ncbi:GntP family permease [Clostridium sp. ZS2-4]|uniref:GntP family permease n=1 Tax=Clostridium sp. ZS2-4 TaxID=2987703 RepID=UPI00227BB052|nr:Na+/H+ antiporter NhaC family protein [Clostridium sp. ZS2-4]MCY6354906.1 SLC13 family permease [Clostridium sp. ZS2-4]